MKCDYCGKDPGKKKGSDVWAGFKDAMTGHRVCWSCRDRHYENKKQNENNVQTEKR